MKDKEFCEQNCEDYIMYVNMNELKLSLRKGEPLSVIFEKILGSKLALNFDNNPFFVLEQIGFVPNARDRIDMSTPKWCSLSTKKQSEYATKYQKWYSAKKKIPLRKKLKIGSFWKKKEVSLILIPPGRFWMGIPESDSEWEKYEYDRRKKVLIESHFWLGEFPVTQEEWKAVMKVNSSSFIGNKNPIENITWSECQEFCTKIGVKLPTEAQWEYACRAGTTSSYYFAENEDSLDPYICDDYIWYWDNSWQKTAIVGQKPPNAFGLYDMLGNVGEWCSDKHGNKLKLPEDSKIEIRIFRGGNCKTYKESCKSYSSFVASKDDTLGNSFIVGFRIFYQETNGSPQAF